MQCLAASWGAMIEDQITKLSERNVGSSSKIEVSRGSLNVSGFVSLPRERTPCMIQLLSTFLHSGHEVVCLKHCVSTMSSTSDAALSNSYFSTM